MKYLTMNNKEREQLKVFERLKLKEITQSEAAVRLRVTDRCIRKKFKRYLQDGDAGLIHKNRGKESPKKWNDAEKHLTIDLLKNEWHGFGPKFTQEKLKEIHGIIVSRETVRQAMMSAGIWHGKKAKNTHRKRRERKPMIGMMIQLDGSPHDWFEGRAGKCTLLVYIDDATSQILWLEFANAESTESLLCATKNYIQEHGMPQSFYTDFGSVFHVNLNNPEDVKKTQWERACEELNIKVIHAHSPQAKGRVERCNQTMQARLIKNMRLAKISSIEAANAYLRTSDFIKKHNESFAVQPYQCGNVHSSHQSYNLNNIFSIKSTRILANDFTINFNKRIFQLHAQQKTIIRPKNEININVHLDGSITLFIRRTKLSFNEIKVKPHKNNEEKPKCYKSLIISENSRPWSRIHSPRVG